MNGILKANIRTNFLFYRRNRLVLIVSLLFLVVMLLTMVPSFIFTSSNERFRLVTQVYQAITSFTVVLMALVALVSVWYHRTNRCVSLVFTKPCTPETWVLSHYISVLLLFAIGTGIAVLLYLALSLFWGIPIQSAVAASVLYNFVQAMLIYAYLLLLSTWMHPLVAGFLVMLFTESTFYWLALLCRAGMETIKTGARHLLVPLRYLFEGLYYLLPTMSPFRDHLAKLDSGMRLASGNAKYLVGSVVYMLLFVAFCYLLTCFSLRRRRMA